MTSFDSFSLFQLGFFIALFVVTIHTIILGYHWLSYGEDRKRSWFYLTLYVCGVSLILILLALSLTQM